MKLNTVVRSALFLFVLGIMPSTYGGITWRMDSSSGGPNSITVNPGDSGFITGFLEVTGPELGAPSLTWQTTVQFASTGTAFSNITLSPSQAPLASVYIPPSTALFSTPTERTMNSFVFPATNLTSRTELFRIPFAVSAAADLGSSFTFNIVADSTSGSSAPTSVNVNGAPVSGSFGGTEFTINVTAVPEPSSIALLAVAGGGLALRRLRRKSKSVA